MSTTRESPCNHPIDEYVWNGTHFVCIAKVYDKGTVEECGTVLDSPKHFETLRDYLK